MMHSHVVVMINNGCDDIRTMASGKLLHWHGKKGDAKDCTLCGNFWVWKGKYLMISQRSN